MKTTFVKTGLMVGLLLISGLTLAEGEKNSLNSAYLDVEVTPVEGQMVTVKFHKLEEEQVRINIYDTYGVRVHEEKVLDKTAVAKRFDLSQLPAGTYSFEVSNDIYLMKRTIEVK